MRSLPRTLASLMTAAVAALPAVVLAAGSSQADQPDLAAEARDDFVATRERAAS
jgi:hypothetical protein